LWYNVGMKRTWLMGILRYGSGLLIALLIFWGFYGFIKDDNWLAVSALATLILAIAAFWTIRQNYNFRRQEKKERLLNEIIEWAMSIISLRAKSSYKPYSAKKSREMSVRSKLELMGAFVDIHSKETYIRLLAHKLGLKIFMSEVTKHLNNHIRLIDLIFDGKVKKSEVMAKHRSILNTSAESLIKEATKIKATDIS